MANARIDRHPTPRYPSVEANKGQAIYNNPHWTVNSGKDGIVQADKSSIGEQLRLDIFIKQALIDLQDEKYFSQMSGVYNLQKHSGKTIKKFHYLPLLDDRNRNQQGIDRKGVNSQWTGASDPATSDGLNPYGNFYGSSHDMSRQATAEPILTEIGGRVNRVGFTRLVLEGTLHRLGFFYEFTNEALAFDSDSNLLQHMGREAMRAAYQIQEDMIGASILQGAGTVRYAGDATSLNTISGATGAGNPDVVNIDDLNHLAMTLKENKAPNRLKASRGSSMVDTKIIGSGYALYVDYDMELQMRHMVGADGHSPAFIGVEHYAAGGNVLRGEIGTIGQFRIISIPRMPHYEAGGAQCSDAGSTHFRHHKGFVGNIPGNVTTTNDYYDVYPLLALSSEAFTCLGFQADMGGKGNFKMITKMPGAETADKNDPYGESGFTSIKWTHGMMFDRPEWVAVLWSACYK